MNDNKTILAVDFANVALSSYFGKDLINSSGMNVNAIKGFFFKIKNSVEEFQPDYIIFAEDIPRTETFRRKLFPPYKANRKKMESDIAVQMQWIRYFINCLGFPLIKYTPYEADDILGMVAKFGDDNGYETIILSFDKDLYQLVSDKTSICSPKIDGAFVDREYLLTNYGLLPQNWVELKILQGDSSDNIPGVRGVGHKTALDLIQKYDNVENVYKHLNSYSKGLRDKLVKDQENIPLLRQLMTIVTDYNKISLTEDSLKRGTIYSSDVMRAVYELDLNSLRTIMWYTLIPYVKGGI